MFFVLVLGVEEEAASQQVTMFALSSIRDMIFTSCNSLTLGTLERSKEACGSC